MKIHESEKSWGYFGAGFVAVILLLVLDQWTKYLAVMYLKDQPSISLIDGVLELWYLENRGAAFGMMQNFQWLFVALCAVFVAAMIYFYGILPLTKRMLPLHILVVLAVAGGIGNAIDRVLHRYVVDFIYVSLIDFPVFNVADCYVTVSAVLLIGLLLFYYKEEDFAFINGKKKDET